MKKTMLITGAAGGIGQATVRLFSQKECSSDKGYTKEQGQPVAKPRLRQSLKKADRKKDESQPQTGIHRPQGQDGRPIRKSGYFRMEQRQRMLKR